MIDPTWLPLAVQAKCIPAKPTGGGLWTLVCEYVKGPVKLRIKATGSWQYSPTKTCGPDGMRASGFIADALAPSAPIGALIGKVGGSPAEKPDAKAMSFVAGSYTVVVLDDKTEGALFLTMNDQITRFDEHDKEVQIEIEQARS